MRSPPPEFFLFLGRNLGQGSNPASKFAPNINKEGALQFGDSPHGLVRVCFLGNKLKNGVTNFHDHEGNGRTTCYYQGEDKGRIYALLLDCLFFY